MKQKTVLMFALCVFMCVCGCTAKPMDEMGRTDENSDMLSSATENDASRMAPAMQEKVEWPTAEEISATIAAEQVEVYWLADAVQAPEQMTCYSAAALDMEAFWETLNEKMPRATGRVESGTLSIFNGAEQIETILEELNNATGTIFVETSATEENTTIQRIYAQTIDGIVLDTEGYTPGGGAEVVPGIRVDVYEDGRIFIQNPMCVGMKTQTLSKADLMDREEVQMLCRSYYESYGLPCVTVVTGFELVYYNADGVLRPAWSLEQTWYPSAKGHITSQMLDGQTGEYLRQ